MTTAPAIDDANPDVSHGPSPVGVHRRPFEGVLVSRWAYAFVALWAAGWRIVYDIGDGAVAYYFPDSWDYIVMSRAGRVPDSLHGPFVYWVWDRVAPGPPSEMMVVVLQGILGITSALLVLHLLRSFGVPRFGLGVALVFGALPLLIFFDRTILTESVTVFATSLLIVTAWNVHAVRTWWLKAVNLLVLGVCLGVGVSIRPATRYSAIPVVIFALVALAVSVARLTRPVVQRVAIGAGAVALVALAALPAPISLMRDNDEHYGVASLTPALGSPLASRWSLAIECADFSDLHPATEAALLEVCQAPGERVNRSGELWSGGALSATMDPQPEFARIQEELAEVALDSARADLGLVFEQALDGVVGMFFDPKVNLNQYDNGSPYFTSEVRITNFPERTSWFGDVTGRAPLTGETFVMRMLRSTATVPGYLTLLSVIGSVIVCIATVRRRGLRTLVADPLLWFMLATYGSLAASLGVVALGGSAIFRYWAPLMPVVAAAAGCAVALGIRHLLPDVDVPAGDETGPADGRDASAPVGA